MVANILLQAPAFRFASHGLFRPAALASNLMGAWRFNKAPGETDAAAAQRCSRNLAPGAANGEIDRRWPGGVPTFQSGYARFQNGMPLHTNVADFGAGGGCAFVVARTQDTAIVDANTRGFMLGTYGGNTNFGWGFEFSVYSTAQARAIDYNAGGTVQTNTIDMGTSTDLEKWRVYYVETGRVSGSDRLLAAVNLQGDGTTADPADTTLTAGRATGAQTLSIGGRISDSTSNYGAAIHKDIAFVAVFNARPTTGERNSLAAQIALIAADAGLTLGAA